MGNKNSNEYKIAPDYVLISKEVSFMSNGKKKIKVYRHISKNKKKIYTETIKNGNISRSWSCCDYNGINKDHICIKN